MAAALAVTFQTASAVESSDFVFTDDQGHLILRFVGVAPDALSERQRDDIVNSEFSTMVHDRLQADLRFESEPVDSLWAASLEPRLEHYVRANGPEFTGVDVECRSASCRLILDHDGGRDLGEHERLVPVVQAVIESFIAGHKDALQPEFTIAAHYQEPDAPFFKVYVQRAGPADAGGTD